MADRKRNNKDMDATKNIKLKVKEKIEKLDLIERKWILKRKGLF